jgi:uncharacterized protein YccT (UPF0319 family)
MRLSKRKIRKSYKIQYFKYWYNRSKDTQKMFKSYKKYMYWMDH